MRIDFSKVDLNRRPALILCNADGTKIQYLGYAFNIEPELHYNETSSLSFDYPSSVDGSAVPHYDSIVGMREILWDGVGYFILTNPEETNDGMKRIKSCKAYSAEYEFTYKTIMLDNGTYNFYDTLDNENTIMGRIMELMPSWSIGEVDKALIGKYRTFDGVSDNVYNFIKSTIQETYQCIFDFDVLQRKVYVRSMSSSVATEPVYLSTKNLVKDIKIEEQTEDIFTCLDVNGADGVDIRSVNPLGTNKIYDLSYFMTESHVGKDMADKYEQWYAAYDAARLPYFNTTVEMSLEQAKLTTENAKLTTLKGDRSTLDEKLSALVSIDASGSKQDKDIKALKDEIAKKDKEIEDQKALISSIQDRVNALTGELKAINESVAISKFFSAKEALVFNKYVKEESIQDSNFVFSTVTSYTASDINENVTDATKGSFNLSNATVMVVTDENSKSIFSITGGTLSVVVNGKTLSAAVVRGAIERASDTSFVLTAYLNRGTFKKSDSDTTSFESGCVSMTGKCGAISHDCKKESTTGAWADGTKISASSLTGYLYLTENATEYQKRSVEWDLFEYGMEQLQSISWPSYTFAVDSCNFLVPDEFIEFRNQLALGNKIYLDVNGRVLEPILIGCSFSFEDLASLTLEFGDKYNCRDARFDLTDLLDQSISAGKSVDFNKYNYNAFVDSGASNSVYNFMNAALDAAKNAVLAGTDQSISIDNSGIRLRKADGKGGFEDEQIWMISNSIVFTDDNWNTAKMAIGQFKDSNLGTCWGVVAPNIVGTLLAGNNLVIESSKKDGGVAVFRVDANGAQLHNAKFDLIKGNGQIDLYPETGLVGGISTSSYPLFTYDSNGNISGVRTKNGEALTSVSSIKTDNLPNANFWIDMNGNAYLKGKVFATDGEFTGKIKATSGEFTGTIKASTLEGTLTGNGGAIKGVSLGIGGSNFDNFVVDEDGNVTMNGSINLSNGTISWSKTNTPVQYQFSKNGTSNWHTTMQATDLYRRDSLDGGQTWGSAYQFRGTDGSDAEVPKYITETCITPTQIQSPTIVGNNMEVYGSYKVLDADDNALGYMGAAQGKDAWGNITKGVALASKASIAKYQIGDQDVGITYATLGNYVIATDAGCRMKSNNASIVTADDSSYLEFNNGARTYKIRVSIDGCEYYDGSSWKSIGSGSETVTIKWG